MAELKEVYDRLGKIERILAALYNTEVTPTNGLIPQLKQIMDNHLKHHEDSEDKLNAALNIHLENHEVWKEKKSDRWFKIFVVVIQAAMAVTLGVLLGR